MKNQHIVCVSKKGRFVFPVGLRKRFLDSEFYISYGRDRYIQAYTPAEWEKLTDRVKGLPKEKQLNFRLLFSHTMHVELESGRRITIPEMLREYAGISKYAVIKENDEGFEIWDFECFYERQ